MRWPPGLRVAGAALALVAVQGLLVLIYMRVEERRHGLTQSTFDHEVLIGTAPELSLVRPDGSSRRLSQLQGKTILLHFWASWCPPCREELPGLLEIGRELSRQGRVEVVAISLDEDWEAVREFFGGKIPPEIFRDDGAAAGLYAVSILPDTYLVQADGTLGLRFLGARDWRSPAARALLRRYAVE